MDRLEDVEEVVGTASEATRGTPFVVRPALWAARVRAQKLGREVDHVVQGDGQVREEVRDTLARARSPCAGSLGRR
jgi:hypothetical protein